MSEFTDNVTARRVTRRLYDILGVQLRRGIPTADRVPDRVEHPGGAPVAFSKRRKSVYYEPPQDAWLLYLPHEAVHVVWPDIPVHAGDEWLSGMISYELAWLERLCQTQTERACLDVWQNYANEGLHEVGDLGDVLEEARYIVALNLLPNPWSA